MTAPAPVVTHLGLSDYESVWRRMQAFADAHHPERADEIWVVEHPPVFTLGLNAKPEHVLAAGEIPVIQVDRGGEVTYHGPGQLVVYPLVEMTRLGLGARDLVCALERAVVSMLADYGIESHPRADAPGVYVDGKKIASIGLRIRNRCSYHGMALNVAMDLSPFQRINPCGFRGLEITQISELGGPDNLRRVADDLLPKLIDNLGYNAEPALQANQKA